jgi:hypothetical protein
MWLVSAALVGCGSDPSPSALRINPPSVVLGVGQEADIGAYFVVEGSSEPAEGVTWSADDEAVVMLAADGAGARVTGVGAGTTQVSATADDLLAAAMVTVRAAPAVTDTSPTDGADGVTPPVDVEITFSLAMSDSLTAQTTAGGCSGAIQLSGDGFGSCLAFTSTPVLSSGDTVATLTPVDLAADTTYKLRVTTAAESADGVALTATYTHATGFTTAPSEPCATGLVISQIYGGGGGTGAPFTHDFIELHNAGNTPVTLGGKAIQYAGAGGTGAWGAQALPSATVPAGGYFLIQEGAGAGTGSPLPQADFTPGTAIGLSPTAGKVALTSTTTPLDGTCPTTNVLDRVGYGASNCFEGSAPAPAPSNTTSVQRRGLGCIDATENDTDFVGAAPAPRNGGTPPSVCSCLAAQRFLPGSYETSSITTSP